MSNSASFLPNCPCYDCARHFEPSSSSSFSESEKSRKIQKIASGILGPINKLSNDLLHSIFLYLPSPDIFRVSATNRFMYAQANDPLLFNDLFARDFKKDLQAKLPKLEQDLLRKRIYTSFHKNKELYSVKKSCHPFDIIGEEEGRFTGTWAEDLLNGNIVIAVQSKLLLCSIMGDSIEMQPLVSADPHEGTVETIVRLSDQRFLTADTYGKLIFWGMGGEHVRTIDTEDWFEENSEFDAVFQFPDGRLLLVFYCTEEEFSRFCIYDWVNNSPVALRGVVEKVPFHTGIDNIPIPEVFEFGVVSNERFALLAKGSKKLIVCDSTHHLASQASVKKKNENCVLLCNGAVVSYDFNFFKIRYLNNQENFSLPFKDDELQIAQELPSEDGLVEFRPVQPLQGGRFATITKKGIVSIFSSEEPQKIIILKRPNDCPDDLFEYPIFSTHQNGDIVLLHRRSVYVWSPDGRLKIEQKLTCPDHGSKSLTRLFNRCNDEYIVMNQGNLQVYSVDIDNVIRRLAQSNSISTDEKTGSKV